MRIFELLQQRLEQGSEVASSYLARLSLRERIMVIFCTIFVFVSVVGSLLWNVHQAATQQQQRADDLKETLLWMQGHAVTMKAGNDSQLNLTEKIQRSAQQYGVAVSLGQTNHQVELIAQHDQYAILANFLMQIAQLGVSIEKMHLENQAGQIKLTATVH